MFSLQIVDTDAFLDMPQSSQLLYYHLAMRADDEGFVSSPKRVMKMIGSSDDDLKVLIAKKFIISFESGVCVIKHWLIHNTIRMDRFGGTTYLKEKAQLVLKDNRAYKLVDLQDENGMATIRQPLGNHSVPQVKLIKVNISKIKREAGAPPPIKKFSKPTLEQLTEYCLERKNSVSPQKFIDHYESNGWKIGGRGAMKDWKAAVRTWESNSFGNGKGGSKPVNVLSTQHSKTLSEKMKEGALKNA